MTNDTSQSALRRIAIVGVGAVGSTTAYAMMQAGTAPQIILVDRDRRRADGERMDLQHCLPFTEPVSLDVRDLEETTDCDMVIVTAGVNPRPGEDQIELIQRNVTIFHSLFPALARQNPNAIFLIITNPVDIMTRVALDLSGLPSHQVIGSGTLLDTVRFRTLLSHHCGILPRHVHAYVIGEHGNKEILVWSRAMIGPFHVSEHCDQQGLSLSPDDTEYIEQSVRSASVEIIERKGATHFAMGLVAVYIAEALASSQNAVFTVSRRFEGRYRLKDVCLSVPTLVDRQGAHAQCELELSHGERSALMQSAKDLDALYAKLDLTP